jgi:GNAT superfamily N-acetyltransferase
MTIYKTYPNLIIRSMKDTDANHIFNALKNQGWHPNLATYEAYFFMQKNNERIIFIAENSTHILGYVTLVMNAAYGPYKNQMIPMIIDLNVFEIYRNQGIASKLLDVLEDYAFSRSTKVCLSVGLHSGYGSAQRLYVKRGYIPDGSGVWYQDEMAKPYSTVGNDDDLTLYFIKERPVNVS